MVVNPYESPRESGQPPAGKPYRWSLFAWDAINAAIWLAIITVLASLLLPAVG